MDEGAPRRCRRCGGMTIDVCIACRQPTCRACGFVAHALLPHLGLPPTWPLPEGLQVPVVCRGCRAR